MNTYSKYVPNVFLAKCQERHDKFERISVETKYGKENECIVHNLIYEQDSFYFYSIIRVDGFDSKKYAEKKVEKISEYQSNALKKSTEYYDRSNKDRDFLSLGEPIKIGHHSEGRHRKIIEQSHNNMRKCIEFRDKAEKYENRIDYWKSRENCVNLSMPESIEYFEYKLEEAKEKHKALKNGSLKQEHNYSLPYAKKKVNELEKKVKLAKKLWQ